MEDNIPKIYAFSVVNDSVAYACGKEGTVIKTTNGGKFTSVNRKEKVSAFEIYPNPAGDFVNIECSVDYAGTMNVSVMNSMGKRMDKFAAIKAAGTKELRIDISDYLPGVYFAILRFGDESVYGQFVVE